MGMAKYDRLLYILNLLRTRRNLNAQALAEECGVTERSIYRDMLALSEANVPIYFENGYKLASDNFLPPLNFSLEEYRFLKQAIESSPLTQAAQYRQMADRLKAKIEAGLSDRVKKDSRVTPVVTHVAVESHSDPRQAEKFFSVIEKAAAGFTTVNLEYESVTSGPTVRKVDPYFVVFRGSAFYFVGYCHLRKDFRTFRVDRIIDVTPTDERFVKKADIRPETYFESGWSVDGGKRVTVEVEFIGTAAKIVASGRYFPNARMEHTRSGHLRYEVEVNGLTEIRRWILGFGDEARVIRPALLKRRLRRVGDYLTSVYDSR
jgi:predicted DNA-binding transcriptional regulator YafY